MNQFASPGGPSRGQGKCIHPEGLEVSRLQIKAFRDVHSGKKGGVREVIIGQSEPG